MSLLFRKNTALEMVTPQVAAFDDEVTERDLDRLAKDPQVEVLQRSSPAKDSTWDRLNDRFFAQRPDVQLRVYGYYTSECNLRFAARMTNVRHFAADCLMHATNVDSIAAMTDLESLSLGIYDLPDFHVLEQLSEGLTKLTLGATRSKKPDLAPLARFRSLRKLYIEGQQKNIDVLAELPDLAELTLRSISTADLCYLAPLHNLWSLDIKLGGIRSFTGIEAKTNIKYLELWQIRGVSDLAVISTLLGLQNLFLQSLPHVTKFPTVRSAALLRRVYLMNMKGLRDFSELEWAPALREFALVEGKAQEPEQLLPVLRNHAIRCVSGWFGSDHKNQRFRQLREESGKVDRGAWKPFEYQ